MSLFSLPQHQFADVRLPELLRVEDTPDLLQFRCAGTGIPIWTQMRVPFFRYIIADLIYSTANIQPPLHADKFRAMRSMARAVAHNARMSLGSARADVLLTTEAIGDQLVNGRLFNRYVDPFSIRSSRRDVVLSDLFEWNWPFPRHNDRLYIHSTIQAAAALRWRLGISARARKDARDLTALVCDRAKELIGWEIGPERRAEMERRLMTKVMGIPLRHAAYRRLLRRIRPKALVSSSACYGLISPLIVAAREEGVVTAEYQHGAICDGHDAYNFAPAIAADEAYRRTLPQYYLSYGSWWHDQVNAPVEMVPIGYPTRTSRVERLTSSSAERRDVLILSDGVEFDLYLALAKKIAAGVAGIGLRVLLRPHPLERTDVLMRYGRQVGDVAIDDSNDLYHALASAHCVVSEGSTGLFEAMGIAERIVMLYTPKARFFFGRHPFIPAQTEEETIEAVRGTIIPAETPDVSQVWAENWQSNYETFLREKACVQ